MLFRFPTTISTIQFNLDSYLNTILLIISIFLIFLLFFLFLRIIFLIIIIKKCEILFHRILIAEIERWLILFKSWIDSCLGFFDVATEGICCLRVLFVENHLILAIILLIYLLIFEERLRICSTSTNILYLVCFIDFIIHLSYFYIW